MLVVSLLVHSIVYWFAYSLLASMNAAALSSSSSLSPLSSLALSPLPIRAIRMRGKIASPVTVLCTECECLSIFVFGFLWVCGFCWLANDGGWSAVQFVVSSCLSEWCYCWGLKMWGIVCCCDELIMLICQDGLACWYWILHISFWIAYFRKYTWDC